MVRVVLFTNTYIPMVGGLERSVAVAHEDLNGAGHPCTVITPAMDEDTGTDERVLRLASLRNIGKRRFSFPLPAPVRIRRAVEAASPDVIHAHQPFFLGDAARRIAKSRRIPFVFTYHTFYERYAHFLPLPNPVAKYWIARLTTAFANQCAVVIAPTASVRDILVERGVRVPIEVAPTGIDVALYADRCRSAARARFAFNESDEIVGHLGRLGREKNLKYLLDAMVLLMLARPSVKWLLVGGGDCLGMVRERLRRAGLNDRLITPGVLEGTDVADAYAAMDVFAFTSRTDTQGLVLAECMAAGVPPVALDAPGAHDCIQDQHNGVLVPARASSTDFALAIDALLQQPAKRLALSAAARSYSKVFTRSRCLSRLLDVYGMAIDAFGNALSDPSGLARLERVEESRT